MPLWVAVSDGRSAKAEPSEPASSLHNASRAVDFRFDVPHRQPSKRWFAIDNRISEKLSMDAVCIDGKYDSAAMRRVDSLSCLSDGGELSTCRCRRRQAKATVAFEKLVHYLGGPLFEQQPAWDHYQGRIPSLDMLAYWPSMRYMFCRCPWRVQRFRGHL